jgi:hypothetical protein
MIDKLLSRLDKVRQIGNDRYQACCCAHEDKTPSLVITVKDSRILLHCFAGCTPDSIVSAAGLVWEDLFEDEWSASTQRAISSQKPLEPVSQIRVDENVLLIVRNKLANGETLTVEDQARAEIAYERIKETRDA